jgi:hypothetical protein
MAFPYLSERAGARLCSIKELHAESLRLTRQLVRTELDICRTVIDFRDESSTGVDFQKVCNRVVAQGCRAVEKLLPQAHLSGGDELLRNLESRKTKLAGKESCVEDGTKP